MEPRSDQPWANLSLHERWVQATQKADQEQHARVDLCQMPLLQFLAPTGLQELPAHEGMAPNSRRPTAARECRAGLPARSSTNIHPDDRACVSSCQQPAIFPKPLCQRASGTTLSIGALRTESAKITRLMESLAEMDMKESVVSLRAKQERLQKVMETQQPAPQVLYSCRAACRKAAAARQRMEKERSPGAASLLGPKHRSSW